MYITATSKDIPGLKYLAVFLKWMVYGDVTIWIALNSASTISPPVSWRRNTDTFIHKLITENFLVYVFPFPLDTIILLVTLILKYYESHMSKNTEWAKNKHSVLTTLCQHTDSYKYGAPHQPEDLWEGLCDVLSLKRGISITLIYLMWCNTKVHDELKSVKVQQNRVSSTNLLANW